MNPYVHSYSDLDRTDDDRDTYDPSVRCWLADEDCDGELREFSAAGGPFFLCQHHRLKLAATIERRLSGRHLTAVA